jgi:hypothetical protein
MANDEVYKMFYEDNGNKVEIFKTVIDDDSNDSFSYKVMGRDDFVWLPKVPEETFGFEVGDIIEVKCTSCGIGSWYNFKKLNT